MFQGDSFYNDIELQCRQELKALKLEEEMLTRELTEMTNQRICIESKVKGLSLVIPALKVIKHEAEELGSTINNISENSEKISSKIRNLDSARILLGSNMCIVNEKLKWRNFKLNESKLESAEKMFFTGYVDECLLRVNDLIDLEICSQGVQQAILDLDYERGAVHIHRFLSMDQSLLKRTANDMNNVPNMLKFVRTLQEAAAQLRAIVQHKFDEAVNNEDLGSIERFFKIFPLLGMHEEGIRNFCTYLRTKIATTADENLKSTISTPLTDKRHTIIYADTLELLFEGLARVIDTHQPLLETYYGPGRLLLAITILQKECNKQVKRIIVEWDKARNIQKKIQQISELSKSTSSAAVNKLEKVKPKDLDLLIGEIALMHFRCELYLKFIERKALVDIEVGIADSEKKSELTKDLDQLILKSDLSQYKHDLLSRYLQLEQYFMEESVAKALSMDITEQSQQTSSMVDDTFFIIRKCIRRSISTGSLDGICVTINNACSVLENAYCDVLKSRIKQGYPSGYLDLSQAYNVLQNSFQQGRLQPGDTEQSRASFVVAMNNSDSSTEYITSLVDSIMREIMIGYPNLNAKDRGKLESCLSGISSVSAKLTDIIEYGIQHLKSAVIKPRINSWMDDFLHFNHQFTEDELTSYHAGESFVQVLIMHLETLLSSFKNVLTSNNYDLFIQVLIAEITQRFEKVIMKCQFNRLGGIILDKEVRILAGYITGDTQWSARDQFARLTQIATILNFDHISEINDYWGNCDSEITWRLTPTEIKAVLNLRSDFKRDEIRRLRL